MWTRVFLPCVLLTTACGTASHATTTAAPRATRAVETVAATTGSVAALGDGKTHSPAAARRLADAGLDLITFPVGSTRLATRPPLGTAYASEYQTVTSQVTLTRWWSVPGVVADVAAFLTADAATGLTVTQPDATTLAWAGFPLFPVGAKLAQDGDHVIVSIGAAVIWTPAKTDIETIPASVTSAQLDYQQGLNTFGHDSRHVVTGANLARLRDAINLNVPGDEGDRLCPADDGGNATVTMRYGGHTMLFTIALTGCRYIAVTSDGKQQPVLDCCAGTAASPSVDTVVNTIAQAPTTAASKAEPTPRRLLTSLTSVPRTLAVDQTLLASLRLPPSAVRDQAPPGQPVDLRDTNQHVVDANQWWTLPSPRGAAVSWVTTHVPRGFSIAHLGTDYDGSAVVVEQPVGVYPSPVELVITLSTKGSGTGVQVEARKFYLPTRSAAETIPFTVKTAQLSIQHGQGPTRRVQVSGPDLTRLIRSLNTAPAVWYVWPCTTTGSDTKLGVLFHTGRHTVNFYWYGNSCQTISVVDGQAAPPLSPPPTALVERLVQKSRA